MIIRLRNLAMRVPVMVDAAAVTRLINTCDEADGGIADETEQCLRAAWQAANFHLEQDGWVVTTCAGELVGYGAVRYDEEQRLTFGLYVHPDYRGRGIGTFLLWLLEERARQLARCNCDDQQVILRTTVVNTSTVARHLFEREGYNEEQTFWRLTVEMELNHGVLCGSLILPVNNLVAAHKRTGMYTARQYIVYAKALQVGKSFDARECEELYGPLATC